MTKCSRTIGRAVESRRAPTGCSGVALAAESRHLAHTGPVDDFEILPGAAVADAIMRLGHTLRVAPPQLRRLAAGSPIVGRALPVRHFGSVDVFLEAFESTAPGSVLVIDNAGRDDEACIGDLTVAEAKTADISAIVLWGLHRDTQVARSLGLPLWSLGATPPGPASARERDGDPFAYAMVGSLRVTAADLVVADDDGVLFVDAALWPEVSSTAAGIVAVEARQAKLVAEGNTLRDQLGFADYLEQRRADASYTFRRHLAERGGAIET